MPVLLWTVAGLVALFIAVLAVLAARRDQQTDDPNLGSVSGGWLSANRNSHDRDSS